MLTDVGISLVLGPALRVGTGLGIGVGLGLNLGLERGIYGKPNRYSNCSLDMF